MFAFFVFAVHYLKLDRMDAILLVRHNIEGGTTFKGSAPDRRRRAGPPVPSAEASPPRAGRPR